MRTSRTVRQRPADKYDERRAQLAESALATLGERGYAHTSLRDIAHNSPFSHGVVHYYFSSKVELIVHGVREYKKVCVTRYDDVLERSATGAELATRFADRLVETLLDDVAMHRLWYDLRTQSMFDRDLRDVVLEIDLLLEQMIWRIVRRHAELSGGEPAFDSPTAYALLDGVFEKAVLAHQSGDASAAPDLRHRVLGLMPALVRP